MKILCLAAAYDSYGASILTTAGEHLEISLRDIEPTNLAVEVTAFLPHHGPPRRTLESSLDRHIQKFPQQVRSVYRAKSDKLVVQYPSVFQSSDSFGRPGGIYAVCHMLPKAVDELCWALVEALRSKPAIWKVVDAARLNIAVDSAKASLPSGPDQLLAYMKQLDEIRRATKKQIGSVDDLDIDWSQYHPDAKRLLDAPFYWSEIDDDAPHGNDTGSDLFAAFKRWNKRNPAAQYNDYVDRLLKRWGLTGTGVRDQLGDDHLDQIRQDADIALAFGAIKLRGLCEMSVALVAIRAVEQRIERLKDSPERALKHSLMLKALQANTPEL